MTGHKRYSFWYRNGLSLVFGALLLIAMCGQVITGRQEFNEEMQEEYQQQPISMRAYLTSGHFLSSTFENWESEFLQMGLYVWMTVFLRQRGSAESKPLGEEEPPRKVTKDSPWPVRRGGWWLKIYRNSLTLAFLSLFLMSYMLHFLGSLKHHNLELSLQGKPTDTVFEYLGQPRIWFESFQNWQSEFLSVLSIVVLSIFLRQKGSPESKPVEAPNDEEGG